MTGAGFSQPAFEGFEATRDISRGRGVESAVETTLEGGPIHRLLKGQPEAVKNAIADDLRLYFASLETAGAILQPASVWIVSASP